MRMRSSYLLLRVFGSEYAVEAEIDPPPPKRRRGFDGDRRHAASHIGFLGHGQELVLRDWP